MLGQKARPKAEARGGVYSERACVLGQSPSPKARPKAEACLYSERLACWVRVRVKSVTPNPTTGTRSQDVRQIVGAPLRHIYTYAKER